MRIPVRPSYTALLDLRTPAAHHIHLCVVSDLPYRCYCCCCCCWFQQYVIGCLCNLITIGFCVIMSADCNLYANAYHISFCTCARDCIEMSQYFNIQLPHTHTPHTCAVNRTHKSRQSVAIPADVVKRMRISIQQQMHCWHLAVIMAG